MRLLGETTVDFAEMPDDIPTLSQALVKEYLTAHGYASSLEAFKMELSSKPVSGSISSRRELAFHLGIKKQVEKNKENGIIKNSKIKDKSSHFLI